MQVLIVARTIEHVLAIKQFLPDFEVIYGGNLSIQDHNWFRREGLWPSGLQPLTREKRIEMTHMFELGVLKKVICTGIWNTGVSFNQLAVLIRADAAGTSIPNTQIPGRVSRIHTDKDKAIVHDYIDCFDPGFLGRSTRRERDYVKNGWLQIKEV